MKNIVIGILLCLSAGAFSCMRASSRTLGSEHLDLLDNELSRRSDYVALRQHKIDSVKALIARDSLDLHNYLTLGQLHGGLNVDSAIATLTRGYEIAHQIGDSVYEERFLISRITELRKLNSITEAINDLDRVIADGLHPENRILYYETGRDLYYTVAEIFEDNASHDRYVLPGLEMAKKLQEELPAGSYAARLNQALIYFAQGNKTMFLAQLLEFGNDVPPDDHSYSMIMTSIGGRYFLNGNYEEAVPYLARITIDEIRNAEFHGTALIRLGMTLYALGDIVRAHRYLSIALEYALAGDAKSNCYMISRALMPVSQALRSQQNETLFALIGFAVALVMAVALLWTLYSGKRRHARELEKIKQNLLHANLSKEAYISEFMNLSSSYMESIEEFNRICKRKITAGQYDELHNFIKSGKLIEEQRQKFDDMFDGAFLAIYPTFVDDVNKLLIPEKRIVTPAKNVLTTELRVLAFTRLGVDDTARVARFLGVTLNTIYTYRNKLRNKAISRENFDVDVMKIGAID
ncbi:MAG: DUF6377 domain-containing protein [Bacteroides sp.]|nr:DUF6377 domain-containing protein [Bacteroides sp.]